MSNQNNYTEFSDPRLVAIYDTLNTFSADTKFYIDLADKLSVSSIVDIGCGTGLLTCELAKPGRKIIGVEPEGAMLKVARSRPGGESVEWVEGDATKLGEVQADLAFMTGHVAQVFLSEESWSENLKAIYRSLRPGGHIAFESRNPLAKPWMSWNPGASRREVTDPILGKITIWSNLLELKGNQARYEMHYLFDKTGEEVVSVNELIFRSQDEIAQSLSDAGFSVQEIYGDWNKGPVGESSPELIFLASK